MVVDMVAFIIVLVASRVEFFGLSSGMVGQAAEMLR